MTGIIIGIAVVLVVVGIPAMWGVGIYNRLVTLRNGYKNSFANVDVQLKRRHDLIPNLVSTAKGYMKHESETLEAVIKARSAAVSASEQVSANPGDPSAMKKLSQAESGLGSSLGRLLALQESYPDLKADASMNKLMTELTSTENMISTSRQAFNSSVLTYNNAREVFPAVIVAGFCNFARAEGFEITDESEREAPKVEF